MSTTLSPIDPARLEALWDDAMEYVPPIGNRMEIPYVDGLWAGALAIAWLLEPEDQGERTGREDSWYDAVADEAAKAAKVAAKAAILGVFARRLPDAPAAVLANSPRLRELLEAQP